MGVMPCFQSYKTEHKGKYRLKQLMEYYRYIFVYLGDSTKSKNSTINPHLSC